jgi:hypothetical protein
LQKPAASPLAPQALQALKQTAPKLWMDADLAVFAITGGYKLITNDQPRRLTLLLPPRYQRQAKPIPSLD